MNGGSASIGSRVALQEAYRKPRIRGGAPEMSEYDVYAPSDLHAKTDIYQPPEPTPPSETPTPGTPPQGASGLAQRVGAGVATNPNSGSMDILGGAAMATGNPYAIGAGAGLMVLGAHQKRKESYRQAEYDAKLARIANQQKAIQNLIDLSKGMKL